VQPRAKHDAIGKVIDGRLQIRTTAPPADGKATAAAAKLLAKHLGIPVSRLERIRGHAHRNKRFLVHGP